MFSSPKKKSAKLHPSWKRAAYVLVVVLKVFLKDVLEFISDMVLKSLENLKLSYFSKSRI